MQKDLFGGAVSGAVVTPQSESKIDYLQKVSVSLRLDQAIIAALALLVAYVLVFSFGVESGKRFAMAEIKAERAMRERMARELGEKIFSNSAQKPGVGAVSSPLAAQTAVTKPALPAKSPDLPAVQAKSAPVKAEQLDSKGRYGIQTVTFTSKLGAERHLKLLASKGYHAMIISKGKFHEVCIAGFESKQSALAIMTQLKSQGLAPKDAYIRAIA